MRPCGLFWCYHRLSAGTLSGAGVILALTGGGDFSHGDGWAMHPPCRRKKLRRSISGEPPKIPLKLRSFLLSPPDPLRWAPAGAPLFGCAEKRKPSRGPSRRFAAHLGGLCTVQKRKGAGVEFDSKGQIRPSTGAGLNRCFRELPVFCRLRLTPYRPLALRRSRDFLRRCFASLSQGP